MDNTRDVRRVGASRFSGRKQRQIINQSGLDGGDGSGVASPEKSKKERLKRLSVVCRVSSRSEMGGGGSHDDGDDKLRPTTSGIVSKRFKLPKKFFDDCIHTVDHASVPRKLRSAMKKRSESVSPPLPDSWKLNHTGNGVELLRKDNKKKSKLNVQQGYLEGSPGQAVVGPITKDEEEVVKTLYALAGMFSDTDKTDKTKLDDKLSETISFALPEAESSMPAFEVPKKEDDSKAIFPTGTAEVANHSLNLEGSAEEAMEVQSFNEPSQTDLPNSKQFPMELDSYVPRVNLPTKALFSKSEPTNERRLSSSSVVSSDSSELGLGTGSKQPKQDGTPASGKKSELALGLVGAFRSQHELQSIIKEIKQPVIKEGKSNGPALWPGLSSTGLHGAEMQGPSFQSSAAKHPAWLGKATSAARPCSSEKVVLTEKDSRASVDRKKSCKRCSAHVYISRLIKVLQIAERQDRLPMQTTPFTTDEGSKRISLSAANNLHGIMNGVVSTNIVACSTAEKSPNEVRNAILLHKRLLQDQQQASTTSGMYTLQKPSFDFLPVLPGGCAVEGNSGTNRAGSGMEPLAQFHVPYLHSLAQNHAIMPLSLPQNHYSSTSFPDHLSAAAAQQVQIQVPPYLGNPFSGPSHLGATRVLPKQNLHQQQIWTAQYRPGEFATAHLSNWKNSRQDSPSLVQYAQAIPPPSHSSLEGLSPKYAPISPQQQQFISIASLHPPTRLKRQHHYLPSGYNGNGGEFHPDSAPPLPLLCNEHLQKGMDRRC